MKSMHYIRTSLREVRSIFRDKQFTGLLSFVVLLVAVGSIFYINTEHWSALDAMYFCVVTLTTVGYGDITPRTDAGKVFTMFYALVGIGVLLGFINVVARHTTKRYLRRSETYIARMETFLQGVIENATRPQNRHQ